MRRRRRHVDTRAGYGGQVLEPKTLGVDRALYAGSYRLPRDDELLGPSRAQVQRGERRFTVDFPQRKAHVIPQPVRRTRKTDLEREQAAALRVAECVRLG